MEATGKAAVALAETSKRLDKVKPRGCLFPSGRIALKQDGQKVKKCKQKRMLVAFFDQQMKTFE